LSAARRSCAWILALLAFAFGGSAIAADKLYVGTPEATGFIYASVNVGIDAGIFKKYDLDVERLDFAGGAKLHQAMTAGSLDLIIGTGSDLVFLMRGAPERAVAAFANDLHSLAFVVRSNENIKTLADFKGKSVGVTTVASYTSWIARQMSIKQGWGPDGVKLVSLGTMSGIVAGLMAKNVDAIVGTSASGLLLQSEGRGVIVGYASDVVTNFIAHMIYASEPLMKEHPDQLRRFLRGWFETIAFMKSNRAETIRITQNVTKMPDEIAAKIYDNEIGTFFNDGHFDREKLAAVKQSFVDVGLVTTLPPDDTLINETFLP
jgi:ABC-type nitrate/sulfonate/bicarbonate transport system substrate-binding protein